MYVYIYIYIEVFFVFTNACVVAAVVSSSVSPQAAGEAFRGTTRCHPWFLYFFGSASFSDGGGSTLVEC